MYDVHMILGFFDPLPLLCPQFLYFLSATLGDFLTSFPFCAHVICGSPLIRTLQTSDNYENELISSGTHSSARVDEQSRTDTAFSR